jgi:RNA polymerase sigma factor (sigma-70 family)
MMPTGQINRLAGELRRMCLQATGDHFTDGQLLEGFIGRRDESAFTALVRRHGPMVLGVCRRVLGNPHDADDAFQATFLVLVRKASSVRPREAVGAWLHGVAYRTALDLRGKLARQWSRERQVAVMPEPAARPSPGWTEVRLLLDAALGRLPEKYRLPIVLCDLEGRSRAEVARQLGIPEGTLSSRLATARQRLARRLAHHGAILPGATLAALIAENTASAAVSVSLLAATVEAAMWSAAAPAVGGGVVSINVATLTEGVLQAMFLTKLKITAAVLVGVAALGLGTGGVMYQAQAGKPQDGAPVQSESRVLLTQAKSGNESRPREQQLRLELEQARLEIRQLREQLASVRDQADARKLLAESRLQEARDAWKRSQDAQQSYREQAAQADAHKLLAEARLREAQDAWKRSQDAQQFYRETAANRLSSAQQAPAPEARPDPQPVRHPALDDLQKEKAEILQSFRSRRKALENRLRLLEEQEAQQLEQLEQKSKAATRHATVEQLGQKNPGTSPAADKLSQILERLEQMDRRLRRLEEKQLGAPRAQPTP